MYRQLCGLCGSVSGWDEPSTTQIPSRRACRSTSAVAWRSWSQSNPAKDPKSVPA